MIELKPLNMEQLEFARQLHNDPDVLKMLTDPHQVSVEEQFVWFVKLQGSKKSQRLVAFLDNVPIGVVRLDQIDYYNKSVCVGLDIHKDYRGKGYSKPIYEEVFKKWFGEEKFHRMWLLVISYNTVAKNLYKSLGFVKEGTQTEAIYRDGQYWDYDMMYMLSMWWRN